MNLFLLHFFFFHLSFEADFCHLYGIDLVPIPRYIIPVSYRSQKYGIKPSLLAFMSVYLSHWFLPFWTNQLREVVA